MHCISSEGAGRLIFNQAYTTTYVLLILYRGAVLVGIELKLSFARREPMRYVIDGADKRRGLCEQGTVATPSIIRAVDITRV